MKMEVIYIKMLSISVNSAIKKLTTNTTSVIRQKGESQKGVLKEKKARQIVQKSENSYP